MDNFAQVQYLLFVIDVPVFPIKRCQTRIQFLTYSEFIENLSLIKNIYTMCFGIYVEMLVSGTNWNNFELRKTCNLLFLMIFYHLIKLMIKLKHYPEKYEYKQWVHLKSSSELIINMLPTIYKINSLLFYL